MVNLDMVGRQGVCGWQDGFPYDLEPLYEKYPFASDITYAQDTGDSDHSSWWQAGVPAVFLHTGLHPDYHRPTDTADKINYDGMQLVSHYAYDLVKLVIVEETPLKPVPYIIYGDK
jgi:hypothetical protein